MDEIARYNRDRWRKLVAANAVYTQPALDLDAAAARRWLDPDGRLGSLDAVPVLVLAGAGGRQSIAFALLGAQVTVLDLSAEQLDRDRSVAASRELSVEAVEGDMRDLSAFDPGAFAVVWQPYSITLVPDPLAVFTQVARVTRAGGTYCVQVANPYFVGVSERDFSGAGYVVRLPYVQGALIESADPDWVAGGRVTQPAREYRHTLAALANGLIESGFTITHVDEGVDSHPDMAAAPGSWDHFNAIVPPWLTFWTVRG